MGHARNVHTHQLCRNIKIFVFTPPSGQKHTFFRSYPSYLSENNMKRDCMLKLYLANSEHRELSTLSQALKIRKAKISLRHGVHRKNITCLYSEGHTFFLFIYFIFFICPSYLSFTSSCISAYFTYNGWRS